MKKNIKQLNQSFNHLLEKVKSSYDEKENYEKTFKILQQMVMLKDCQTDITKQISVNMWRLKAILRMKVNPELNKNEISPADAFSILESLLRKFFSNFQQSSQGIKNVFEDLILLYESIFYVKSKKNRVNFSKFFKAALELLEKASPLMGFILALKAFELFYKDDISLLVEKLEKIERFYEPYLLDILIGIVDDHLEDKNYPIVNLISVKILASLNTENINHNLLSYLITWETIKLSCSRNIAVTEVGKRVTEITKNCEILNNDKWVFPDSLLRRLRLLLEKFESPVLAQLKLSILNSIIGLQMIYIQIAECEDGCDWIMRLINASEFASLAHIFKKMVYTPNMWEILTMIPLSGLEKLVDPANPHHQYITFFLVMRAEALTSHEDSLPLNNFIASRFSNQKEILSNEFLQRYKYIFSLDNGQFLLGVHPFTIITYNFLLVTRNLTLNQELRNIIMLFCAPIMCRGMPEKMILGILKKYLHYPKIPSAGLRNTAACATHHFADNYPGVIDFARINRLFSSHLAQAVGMDALIVKKSLRQLIYAEAAALGKKQIYLTSSIIENLINNAKEQDDKIQNVMSLLGWEVRNRLLKITKLLPLDLSICQLVTALGIMWVNQFSHLSPDHFRQHLSFMAKSMARWIVKSIQGNESEQKNQPSFNFILPVKVNVDESAGEIETCRVKITMSGLVTFFSENLKSLNEEKNLGKRKRFSGYRPWSFAGHVQQLPHVGCTRTLR